MGQPGCRTRDGSTANRVRGIGSRGSGLARFEYHRPVSHPHENILFRVPALRWFGIDRPCRKAIVSDWDVTYPERRVAGDRSLGARDIESFKMLDELDGELHSGFASVGAHFSGYLLN